ncbi:MAG: HTH-type transcriptional regulator NimR [Luteibacter sp.]|uniref:AraC family transcriptional regulator n=1 Tax=Luteibacter sp. TaxID=1886636 RepID=UPI001385F255|nr:helix-turn-helix transcriptional regulator [Luteibacter sp.]KAF1005925.1 MAG: HTH-type transcriptional regulator NimR [Luteibacter sp.]
MDLHFDPMAMPVSGVAIDFPSGHVIAPHTHARSQLVYAVEGVLVVETPEGHWVVPPNRGVWLRAGVAHSVRMRGQARMRSVFVDADAAPGLPMRDCVIDVSPLLRELILAATEAGQVRDADTRDGRVLRLLLDELRVSPMLPLHLPWPDDPRIRRVCTDVVNQPADETTAATWAVRLAMSPKTFHRQFLRGTGITFGRWRQQARLLGSLEALAEGLPVLRVAIEHGYDSQSAFAAVFKRQFGVSPSAFYR